MSKKRGLNVDKVKEMLDNEEIKDVLNNKEEVIDMNNTDMKEQATQDMKEVQSREIFEEESENKKMIDNLNYNIKKAIYISKGYGSRGINGKQLKSIQNSYLLATGCELSEERVNYLKTITDVQAKQVIIVLNKFHRYMRLQQTVSPATN